MGVGTVVVVQSNVRSDYFNTSRDGLTKQILTCINYGAETFKIIRKYFVKSV